MWTMDKLTERTSNIAETKKEMSEELPKPLSNLPWKCHTSIASKGKSTAGSTAPKKQQTTGVPASPAASQPTPLPTAHGGKAMEVETQSSTSQPSGALFSYPFTNTPSQSGTLSAPAQSVPPSAPAPPTQPEDQQDVQNAEPTQKGIQPGALPIPRSFCDNILTVLANLPEEWPLVKST